MILLGVLGEVLKSISALEKRGITAYADLREMLIQRSLPFIEHILDNHYDADRPAFWEISDMDGQPHVDEGSRITVDPGHSAECAGFLAELVPFLPEEWQSARWSKRRVTEAALNILLFAGDIGFSAKGVLFKFVDLKTGEPLPDVQAGVDYPTAPWWNVRELCAAALRLYTLTKDERIIPVYLKGQNASYLFYPNKNIGGQMIQMVDPLTLDPLDVAPATGNLDPMHDPRARIREMENLEMLIGGREH
jgi:mannose/cellobiose epimerase-like protein (N-acyl-D-glucosamine 2-epimerase family)